MSKYFDRIQENINILRYNVGASEKIDNVQKYEESTNQIDSTLNNLQAAPGFSSWETFDTTQQEYINQQEEYKIEDMRKKFKSDSVFSNRFLTDLVSPFNGQMFMNRELNPQSSAIKDDNDNENIPNVPLVNNNNFMENDSSFNSASYASFNTLSNSTSNNFNFFNEHSEQVSNTNNKLFNNNNNYIEQNNNTTRLFRN